MAGGEFVPNHHNRALGEEFLIFGMVLGMVLRFKKITGHKLGAPPSGLFALNQIFVRSV